MSFLSDSIGLPRHVQRSTSRRFNLSAFTSQLDELASPARMMRSYFQQRTELREARRALERALQPRVWVQLQCKKPDGRNAVELVI